MSGTVEPGWYPDPRDASRDRWWDGSGWTDQTRAALRADPGVEQTVRRPVEVAQPRPSALPPPTGPPIVLPPVAGPPVPGPAAPPPGPAAPPQGTRRSGVPLPVVVGVVAVVVLLAAVVVLAVGRSGGGDTATAGDGTTTIPTSTSTTATTTPPTTPTTPSTTAAPGPMVQLSPVGATASNERAGANLQCGGYMSYGASQLIDGDIDRGWGASRSDGTGQYVDVRFAQPVHLRRISITPGYLRQGQRKDQGCRVVPAFDFNRHVTQVRYTFDDGTSVVKSLTSVPDYQPVDVDTTTTSVRITILGTVRPSGADDDTVISEAIFEGST